jgi:hypothetical protein
VQRGKLVRIRPALRRSTAFQTGLRRENLLEHAHRASGRTVAIEFMGRPGVLPRWLGQLSTCTC